MKSPNLWTNFYGASRHKPDTCDNPPKSLKFKVQDEEYKENIVIQLERITKEESIKVKGNQVTNFFTLATREKKKVDNKRPIPHEIIDQVKIGGLQNFGTY